MARSTSRTERDHPLHDVVGVPGCEPAAARRRPERGRARSRRSSTSWPARTSSSAACYDVAGLRADADLMVWWHAETDRGAAGGLRRLRRTSAGPAPEPGLVADGAAPAGRVQQEPHPGVPGRRGAAPLRLRLPVRALLRVVPAARRGAPRHARRARQMAPRLPRRAGQHGRRRSRSATTSGCSPSRPTSCTASSTSCATCAPPRPAGTSARRSRSTPGPRRAGRGPRRDALP